MALPAEQFFAAKMRGEFLIGEYNSPKLLSVGAYADPVYSPTVEDDTIPNLLTDNGGNYETDSNVSGISLTVNLYNFNPAMTARMLNGTATAIANGSVADEVVTVFASGVNYLVRLNRLLDTGGTAPVVKSFDGVTTYAAITDYIAHEGGLEIVAGGAIEAAADAAEDDTVSVKVSYDNYAQDIIESTVDFSNYFTARFILDNKVRGANPEFCDVWKFKFASGDFPLVDQTFKVKAVTLNLDTDLTRGTGESAYMRFARKVYA
jgi:hypothetical protein